MEKRKVIKYTNLPTKFPLTSTILYVFLLYHFDAPQWAWTLFIVLYALLWITCIVRLFNDDQVEILNNK